MASTSLSRTQTAGNQKTWTLSVWFKRSNLSTSHIMPWCAGTYTSTNLIQMFFSATDCLDIHGYDSGGSLTYQLTTNRVFRDTCGWYNLVVSCDTTQAVASDRLKIYINGVQETSLSTASYPAEDHDTAMNQNTLPLVIGNRNGASYYFGGVMSHLHIIDGTAYPASTFGSTDAATGEWTINTNPSVTYGTNGAFILKDGNSVTDQSGEGNNFTVATGTLTATEDCPSDIFSTWNNLIYTPYMVSYNNGNTTASSADSYWYSTQSTLGVTKGKWDFECMNLNADNLIGVQVAYADMDNYPSYQLTGTTLFYNADGGEIVKDNVWTTADYGTFGVSDVMGVAFNMDDKVLSIYKNGVAIVTDYAVSASITDATAMMSMNVHGSGSSIQTNFGNGYFGDTAISSEGTNASGIGKFEYDVPAGFTALSTKGLNS